MPRALRSFLVSASALLIASIALAPVDDASIAQAKSRRGAVAKSKTTRKVSRRPASRMYTVRGNPELARRVSVALIAEKLPELAAIVGIDAPAVAESTVASDAPALLTPSLDALTSTRTVAVTGSYHDSELDETEDPDRLTPEDEAELAELPDDINEFYKEFTTYMASLNPESNITANGIDKQIVMESVVSWLGTRYLFGGMTRSGIDCSAFTGTVYRALDYRMPRTAAMQYQVGTAVDRDDLEFGDLVFFHTRAAVYVSHVGMYLGNDMFVHASSRNGVTVSSLNADYYAKHMIGARRYNLNEVAAGDEFEVAEK